MKSKTHQTQEKNFNPNTSTKNPKQESNPKAKKKQKRKRNSKLETKPNRNIKTHVRIMKGYQKYLEGVAGKKTRKLGVCSCMEEETPPRKMGGTPQNPFLGFLIGF